LPHQREAEVIVVPWLIRFWTQSWKFTPSRHLGSCFAASAGSEFSPTISVANAITNLRIASPVGLTCARRGATPFICPPTVASEPDPINARRADAGRQPLEVKAPCSPRKRAPRWWEVVDFCAWSRLSLSAGGIGNVKNKQGQTRDDERPHDVPQAM